MVTFIGVNVKMTGVTATSVGVASVPEMGVNVIPEVIEATASLLEFEMET
jgi:hypothetical protein